MANYHMRVARCKTLHMAHEPMCTWPTPRTRTLHATLRPIYLSSDLSPPPPKKKNNQFLIISFFLRWSGIQVLEENRRQGEEDQAFEKRVEGKKAAAKKRATRRSAYSFSFSFNIYHWEKNKG